jgi:rod shape-determining protein MreD
VPGVRALVAAVLVVAAVAVQVTMLARLPLPGATPDLVLVVVVALALAHGPDFGLMAGFGAGLVVDLAPPADHTVGRWALVLGLIGFAAGVAHMDARRSAFVPVVVVAGCAGLSVLLYSALGALMSDPHVTWVAVGELLPTAVVYAVVLSPFVVPAVLAAVRRAEPDPAYRH